MLTPPEFPVVLRGYDRSQVHLLVRTAEAALASLDPAQRASALAALQARGLTVGLRGFDRRAVDAYLASLAQTLAEPITR